MKVTVEIEEFIKAGLTKEQIGFISKAQEAADQAYAPYSQFYVGCAVLLQDGTIVQGSNQENASFPSGLCAERVALFHCAQNLADKKVKEIAVYARSTQYQVPKLLVPCAACLQVISDIQTRQKSPIKIWMWTGEEDVYLANDVGQFLPFHFELNKQ